MSLIESKKRNNMQAARYLTNLKDQSVRLFSRSGFTLLLLLVFASELGITLFVIRDLLFTNDQIQKMYDGSVLGLRRIGELQYEAQETRRSTLYALTTNDGNLQVAYADQSRAADHLVSAGIADYLAREHDPREVVIGKRLASDWESYLKIRDDVLGHILENSTREAVDLDLAMGVTLFDRVREDLEEIKRLYDERASQQLRVAARSSRRSVITLIGALAGTLLLGSIVIWAIQRNKMKSELQLARMQMDFVASVSHELRTPITAILSAGENVRDGMVEGPGAVSEQGSIIAEQASQLMDLVDQVLLFAATTRGIEYHNPRALEVAEIVDSALRNTQRLLEEAGFIVDKHIEPGLPRIIGDLPALSQCFQNLIVNAVKYARTDHFIRVMAKSRKDKGVVKEIEINVQDHGVGIPHSSLPHIFEPFFRSPQVVSAQIHGTGLGLSIARRNVEAFGGRISVVSAVNVGSIFTVHLPVAEQDFEVTTLTSDERVRLSK